MKILEFKKTLMFILSLVFVALAILLMFLNNLSYKEYLEMKQEFVEVDCTVVEVDNDKRTIIVAYVYKNIEYQVELQTIEYDLMDHFIGVIKPQEPTKLRFDNGYDMWNVYSYLAIILVLISILFNLLILKRLLVRLICLNAKQTTINILDVKSWLFLHCIVVEYNGKKYYSEIFRTFDNIHLLEENVTITFKKRWFVHHIDLSTYKKNR